MPRGKRVIELRRLCGYHHTIPASYQLEGITKEGDQPLKISQVAKIWKGVYRGEVVALKVLRISWGYPHAQRIQSVSASYTPQGK